MMQHGPCHKCTTNMPGCEPENYDLMLFSVERPTTKCVLAASRIGADKALPGSDQHAIHMLPKCFLPARYQPPDAT